MATWTANLDRVLIVSTLIVSESKNIFTDEYVERVVAEFGVDNKYFVAVVDYIEDTEDIEDIEDTEDNDYFMEMEFQLESLDVHFVFTLAYLH